MSLDVMLVATIPTVVYDANITHNLGAMAEEAGIYKHLWRPEEAGIEKAEQLIEPLRGALRAMRKDSGRFKKHNPSNGWGDYESFYRFVDEYLQACVNSPEAKVRVSR